MKNCHEIRPLLPAYLDGELAGTEVLPLEAHLMDCDQCRSHYETLLHVVGSIRSTNPLFAAPAASYEKAQGQIAAFEAKRRRVGRWKQMAVRGGLAAGLLAGGFVLWSMMSGSERFGLATYAADQHARFTAGSLPLDIQSGEERVVESWLRTRVAFPVRLPPYSGGSTKPYRLVGARLVSYRNSGAAFLAYQIHGRPVSLVIAAAGSGAGFPIRDPEPGGVSQRLGRVTFHTAAVAGSNSISWVDEGLSYSIVSESGALSAEACVVCHSKAAERPKIAHFRPRS